MFVTSRHTFFITLQVCLLLFVYFCSMNHWQLSCLSLSFLGSKRLMQWSTKKSPNIQKILFKKYKIKYKMYKCANNNFYVQKDETAFILYFQLTNDEANFNTLPKVSCHSLRYVTLQIIYNFFLFLSPMASFFK